MSAPAAPPDACAPEVAQVMRDLFVWHLRGVTIQMVEPAPGGVRLGVRGAVPTVAEDLLRPHYGFRVACYAFV